MAYDYSGLRGALLSTFGETVTHQPSTSGYADQDVTMIFADPSTTGEMIPGIFAVLTGDLAAFAIAPVRGDQFVFRGNTYRVFSEPAVVADGMIRVSLSEYD